MNPDLFFVLGLLIGALAVPAVISAFSEGRPPRAAAIMIMVSAGLLLVAVLEKPGGYAFGDIPDVFLDVVADVVR